MSVLIKGIDMPKEPWDCPCHNGETGQCKVINIGCYDYIPKNCPLVEIPTPHGRLIDADALEKRMLDRELELNDDRALWESSAVSVALDMFAPTIIEAESEE